jgi:anti-sigma B factor antagonist
MKLCETSESGIDLLHLEGEIDMHYAPVLRALLQAKAKQRCPAVVVDLAGVSFIDSTGIAVLIEYLRDAIAFDGRFCLARPTEHVRVVFDIVQLGKFLPIHDTIPDALRALRNRVPAETARHIFGGPRDANHAVAA